MALDKKLSLLRDRAARALGEHRVDQAVGKVRAIIGPVDIPASEPLAQSARDKLHQGEVPTPDELAALEIVIRLLRPVLFSRDGVLDDLPDAGQNLHPQELKDAWSTFRQRVKKFVPSVGRIETMQGRHIGTGFLVRNDLLATNRHVLAVLTFGSEVLAPSSAQVVFKQEIALTNRPSDIVPIEGVASIHPKLDMALFRVAPQDRRPMEIQATAAGDGDRVAVIGYPGNDPINNPQFLASVFSRRFGVRRASLGEVLDGTESPQLFHDSSTTQGNSGSPIFSLASAAVVGIHRSGFFMYRNEGVDSPELSKFIQNVRN